MECPNCQSHLYEPQEGCMNCDHNRKIDVGVQKILDDKRRETALLRSTKSKSNEKAPLKALNQTQATISTKSKKHVKSKQNTPSIDKRRSDSVKSKMGNYKKLGVTEANLKKLTPLVKELAEYEFTDKPLTSTEAHKKARLRKNIKTIIDPFKKSQKIAQKSKAASNKNNAKTTSKPKKNKTDREREEFVQKRLSHSKTLGFSESELEKLRKLTTELSQYSIPKRPLNSTDSQRKEELRQEILSITEKYKYKPRVYSNTKKQLKADACAKKDAEDNQNSKKTKSSNESDNFFSSTARVGNSIITKEMWDQEIRDYRDATRGFGRFFREDDGKYVSIPLYDNHDDESDPD